LGVTIKPEVVDPSDLEMLQDLVLAASNEALEKARELAAKEMGAVTAGMGLPPGLMGEGRGRLAEGPAPLTRGVEGLGRLPGGGPKTAPRLSCYNFGPPASAG